jgi:DNA-binding MarR family transcriptional regulator
LATAESMRAQSMGAIVDSLTTLGLVTRTPDVVDRRRIVIALSSQGRASLAGVRQNKARRLSTAIQSELTPDEVGALQVAIPLLKRIGHIV